MGCPTSNDRFNGAKALLDYGFSTFPRQVLAEKGEVLGRVPVGDSLLHALPVAARETVAYPLGEGEEVTVKTDLPEAVPAPVVQGEIAGQVTFWVGQRQVGQTYLVWAGSASRDVVKKKLEEGALALLQTDQPPGFDEMLALFSKGAGK